MWKSRTPRMSRSSRLRSRRSSISLRSTGGPKAEKMMRKTVLQLGLLGFGALLALGQSSRPAASKGAPAASFDATIRPFLAKTCAGCHNEKLKSSQLDLTQYKTKAAVAEDPDRWQLILKRL